MNSKGDFDTYNSLEVYIHPPVKNKLFTGDIIKKDNDLFVVLMPSCDLANDGKVKQVVIGSIGSLDKVMGEHNIKIKSMENKIKNYDNEIKLLNSKIEKFNNESSFKKSNEELVKKIKVNDNKNKKENDLKESFSIIKKICTNNYKLNWHFLPKTTKFDGGIIDFTNIQSISIEIIKENSEYERICSISSSFVKDITSRFSQYYARQGQPSLNVESIIDSILDK